MAELQFSGRQIASFSALQEVKDKLSGEPSIELKGIRPMGTSSDQFLLRQCCPGPHRHLADPLWEVVADDGTAVATGLHPGKDLYKDRGKACDYIIFQGQGDSHVIIGTDEFPKIPTRCTYSLRPAPIDRSEAILAGRSDLAEVASLCSGTMILTPNGERPVESLVAGDLVTTMDASEQRIVWIGESRLNLGPDNHHLAPIRISRDAIAPGYPHKDLLVSPDHLILLKGWEIELHFGADEAFVPAKHLVNGTTIAQLPDLISITYHHILLDNHEVMFANGLECESLLPDTRTLSALPSKAKLELLRLGPISDNSNESYPVMPSYVAQACFGIPGGETERHKLQKRLAA